jgi:hypothetical protein
MTSTKKDGTAKATLAKVTTGNGIGKPRAAILAALAKAKGPMTRAEIGLATGLKTGFTSLLGHVDPAKREDKSLLKLGLIAVKTGDDCTTYAITAAGTKALAAAKKGGE